MTKTLSTNMRLTCSLISSGKTCLKFYLVVFVYPRDNGHVEYVKNSRQPANVSFDVLLSPPHFFRTRITINHKRGEQGYYCLVLTLVVSRKVQIIK